MARLEDLAATLRRGEPASIAGALFDMDGTLVDSIAAVEEAWRLWAHEYAVPVPTAAMHGKTGRALVAASGVEEHLRSDAETRLEEIEARPGQRLEPLPGVRSLVGALPHGRWGVVTSASRPVAVARYAAAGLPDPAFRITGDDVARSKPDPEPFRRGVQELRAAGHRGTVIAFEDTVAGATSARAAGCLTIGVLGTVERGLLESAADIVVDTLESMRVRSQGHQVFVTIAG